MSKNRIILTSAIIIYFSITASSQNLSNGISYGIPSSRMIGQLPALSSPNMPIIPGAPIFGVQNLSNRHTISSDLPTNLSATIPTVNREIEEAERELVIAHYKEDEAWYYKTELFRKTYNTLSRMDPENFSLTKAVFLVENAYMDNQLSYPSYLKSITLRADLVSQICKAEGLDTKNSLAINYAIQKLFSKQNSYYDSATRQSYLIKPLSYDFDDVMGQKDLTKTFVSKLLATGKGQCHSLPIFYKILAEKLGARAYLSLSPQHMYIKFAGRHGTLYNYETTSGNIVSNSWINQSGFITAKAIQQHIYADTLSSKKLYAEILDDFLISYLAKFGNDLFAEEVQKKILQTDPNNIRALMIAANIKLEGAIKEWKLAGSPKMEAIENYPQAYNAYISYREANEKVGALGYQNMPEKAYQYWLKSIEDARVKQKNQDEQNRYEREIHELNKIKVYKIKSPNL